MIQPNLTLLIGNKNLSSWSFRPWILMRHFDIPFTEELIRLDEPASRASLRNRTPAGLVPCLIDHTQNDLDIWDSLAICEYMADQYPEKNILPRDPIARAICRAAASEMHAGFDRLRGIWPMECARQNAKMHVNIGVKHDLKRIFALWDDCRNRFGAGGDFLFGDFTIADAMFAPVISRIRTYGPLDGHIDQHLDAPKSVYGYIDAMEALPAFQEWVNGAKAEKDA